MKVEGRKIVEIKLPEDTEDLMELVKRDKPEGIYVIEISATLFAEFIKWNCTKYNCEEREKTALWE